MTDTPDTSRDKSRDTSASSAPRMIDTPQDYRIAGYTPRLPSHDDAAMRESKSSSASEDTGGFKPLVTLPPYVVSFGGGKETGYAFVVPAGVRPRHWPVSMSLGSDGGKGAAGIRAKAWAVYAELLHAMHKEELAFERKIHPGTLKDAAERFRESHEFSYRPSDERNELEDHLDLILDWADLNDQPPMATITQPHAYAFLMSRGETLEEQAKLADLMSHLYDAGIKAGYTDINIMKGLTLPAAEGRTMKSHLDLAADFHIFARPPALKPR